MLKKKIAIILISIIVIAGVIVTSVYFGNKHKQEKLNAMKKTPAASDTTKQISPSTPIAGSIGVAKGQIKLYSSPGKVEANDPLLNGQVVNITGEDNGYYQIYLYGTKYYVLESDVLFYQNPYFTELGEPCSLISSSNGTSLVLLNGITTSVPTNSLTKITPGENAFAKNISHMPMNFAFGTNLPIIQKAQEITKNYSTQYEKAQALYVWEATHIKYDFQAYNTEKAKSSAKGVTVNELDMIYNSASTIGTFQTKLGICTGYARLYSALCEAVGIPVRTVVGGNHEWNQINTGKGWFDVDVTWAAAAYYPESEAVEEHTQAGGFSTSNTEVITNPFYNAKENSKLQSSAQTYAYFNNPLAFSAQDGHPKADETVAQST
ncbi:MAG: transglutaminase domain-containing protein [Sarcina sp.]